MDQEEAYDQAEFIYLQRYHEQVGSRIAIDGEISHIWHLTDLLMQGEVMALDSLETSRKVLLFEAYCDYDFEDEGEHVKGAFTHLEIAKDHERIKDALVRLLAAMANYAQKNYPSMVDGILDLMVALKFAAHTTKAAALEASEADKILPEIILKLRKLWAVNFTKQNSLHEPPRAQKRGKK